MLERTRAQSAWRTVTSFRTTRPTSKIRFEFMIPLIVSMQWWFFFCSRALIFIDMVYMFHMTVRLLKWFVVVLERTKAQCAMIVPEAQLLSSTFLTDCDILFWLTVKFCPAYSNDSKQYSYDWSFDFCLKCSRISLRSYRSFSFRSTRTDSSSDELE